MVQLNKVLISVLIPTRNEEINIKKCLESVKWADEIFIVDSNSHDRTVEIAQQYTDHIINFSWNGKYPRKKNWALDNLQFSHEWLLIVDADEEVTPELQKEITSIARNGSEYDAYMIRYNYNFLGKQLKFGDPLWKCIFFKHKNIRFERLDTPDVTGYDVEVHEHPVVRGCLGQMKSRMIHHDFQNLHHYFERHNVYSDWEAALQMYKLGGRKDSDLKPSPFGTYIQKRRFIKEKFLRNSLKPIMFFIYAYIFRLGFLDGKAGFIYNSLKAIYWFEVDLKIYERKLRINTSEKTTSNN